MAVLNEVGYQVKSSAHTQPGHTAASPHGDAQVQNEVYNNNPRASNYIISSNPEVQFGRLYTHVDYAVIPPGSKFSLPRLLECAPKRQQ